MHSHSRLFLDRAKWRLSVEQDNTDFVPVDGSRERHRIELQRRIKHVFDGLDLDTRKWVLPLSGGVDSRAILLLLKNRENLRCITWGLKSALTDRRSDAYVAARLVELLDLDHRYFETDLSTEPPADLFNRYLVAGEGRVDAVGGYMDGFKIWKRLFEEDAAGIIRGDECFGMRQPVFTPFGVRRYVNCLLLSDYGNIPKPLLRDLPEQSLPRALDIRNGEPILTWRDRLYHHFRMPLFMAALNDLKCAYVEVANPFLSRSIVTHVRTIPDELRSSGAASVLPASLRDFLTETLRVRGAGEQKHQESLMKRFLPRPLTRWAGRITKRQRELYRDRHAPPALDPNVMAFRAFIICRMHEILDDDARALMG